MTRSLTKLTKADLRRLGQIAAADQADLFSRKPETGRLYAKRLFAGLYAKKGSDPFFVNNQIGPNGSQKMKQRIEQLIKSKSGRCSVEAAWRVANGWPVLCKQ